MKSLKGHLLIAAPMLSDPNFARSVVFMCEHQPEAAMGLVINRPTNVPLGMALPQLPIASAAEVNIYLGGPVETQRMLIVHQVSGFDLKAEAIPPGVFLGADLELLTHLLESDETFRVFRGYAGWGRGQLDMEIREGAWLTTEATLETLFAKDTDDLWQAALREVGGVHGIWADLPPKPELN